MISGEIAQQNGNPAFYSYRLKMAIFVYSNAWLNQDGVDHWTSHNITKNVPTAMFKCSFMYFTDLQSPRTNSGKIFDKFIGALELVSKFPKITFL